ncbi:hypothetical protein ACIREE_42525 [Streptomyces sp. NPDC102467]|uniref:hypothetical protein n=1 Tax=Streptomyces sp. NPDC102467 TaxID=3366179 RepID=UPI0037FFA088
MRRSTLLTRALGTCVLAATATAMALVYVRSTKPAPRLDLVATLAAAVVLTAAWALACRSAPPLTAPTPASPAPARDAATPPIPSRLPALTRDFGRATGTVLILLAPVTLARLAMRGSDLFGAILYLLVIVITYKAVRALSKATSQRGDRAKLRVLIKDAAEGEVYAIRVRAGRPLHLRYHERGDGPGKLRTTYDNCLALFDARGREVPLIADRAELARAGAVLADSEGWLLFALRHKLIEEMQPAAFVADRDGTTLLGLTPPDSSYRTATATAQKPLPTSRDRATRPVPRVAKFRLPVHGQIAAGALVAALLYLPMVLIDRSELSGLIAYPLALLAGAALATGVLRGVGETMDCLLKDTEWSVREEWDPEIV